MPDGPPKNLRILPPEPPTLDRVLQIQKDGEMRPSALDKFGGMTFHFSPKDARAPGDCDVVMSQRVYRQVVDHLSRDTSREHGGLLLGYELQGHGSETTVYIIHSLPARHTDGSPTRLDIKADSWAEWDRITDELGRQGVILQRVGWYHSHPNIDIFLSKWDLDVCEEFRRPTQVAMVVDPIGKRGGFFVRGKKGFRGNAPQSFWELHNVSPSSIVEWTNVSQRVAPENPPEKNATEEPEIKQVPAEKEAPVNLAQPAVPAAPESESREPEPLSQSVHISKKIRKERSLVTPLLWAILAIGAGSFSLQLWSVFRLRTVSNDALISQAPLPSTASAAPVDGSAPVVEPVPAVTPPSQQPKTEPPAPASVSINPARATLMQSQTQQFKVTPAQNVNWTINPSDPSKAGKIDKKGFYTAPAKVTIATVIVKATSKADPSQSDSATVSLVLPQPAAKTSAKEADQPPPAKTSAKQADQPPPPPAEVALSISPPEATLKASDSQPFSVTVTGAADTNVEWLIDPPGAGSIKDGTYQAPSEIAAAQEVKVIAKSKADPSKMAQAKVKLTPP